MQLSIHTFKEVGWGCQIKKTTQAKMVQLQNKQSLTEKQERGVPMSVFFIGCYNTSNTLSLI